MPRKIRKFDPIRCDSCNRKFTPKNPKQRTCKKEKCKELIKQDNKYKPVRYRFKKELIEKVLNNKTLWIDINSLGLDFFLETIKFTRNDIEKVKER